MLRINPSVLRRAVVRDAVGCPTCGAAIGELCLGSVPGSLRYRNHMARVARAYKALGVPLVREGDDAGAFAAREELPRWVREYGADEGELIEGSAWEPAGALVGAEGRGEAL